MRGFEQLATDWRKLWRDVNRVVVCDAKSRQIAEFDVSIIKQCVFDALNGFFCRVRLVR